MVRKARVMKERLTDWSIAAMNQMTSMIAQTGISCRILMDQLR